MTNTDWLPPDMRARLEAEAEGDAAEGDAAEGDATEGSTDTNDLAAQALDYLATLQVEHGAQRASYEAAEAQVEGSPDQGGSDASS